MTGYFSHLARQSGVRFSAPGGETVTARKMPPNKSPTPLAVEQTILVAPTKATAQMSEVPRQKGEGRPAEQRIPKTISQQEQVPTFTENIPAPGNKKSDFPPARGGATTRSSLPREIEKTVQATPINSTGAKTKTGENPAIKRTVLVDSKSSGPGKTSLGPKPNEAEGYQKPEQKRYFTKTAEVVGRGDFESMEIQNIMLREVQEWAAAGTAEPDVPVLNINPKFEKVVKNPVPKAASELEAVAIQDHKRIEKKESIENSGSEDQNLNLSIGTISVVVEDPAKPGPRQGEGRPAAPQESARPFSRLSRSYL